MEKIGEGLCHEVWKKNPGFVRKFPKSGFDSSFELAIKTQKNIESIMGSFCPITKVVPSQSSYIIVQKEVCGNVLKDIDPGSLSQDSYKQILEFIYTLESATKDGKKVDYHGYQGKEFERALKSENKILDFIYKIFCLPSLWKFYKDIFQSTNLMVSEKEKVYMIDTVSIDTDTDFGKFSPEKIFKLLIIQKYKRDVKKLMGKN